MNLRRILAKSLRSIPFLAHRASALFSGKRPDRARPLPLPGEAGGAENILVIRLDAIGDFLMTTPSLRALKKRFPEARLDLLLQPGVEPMARGFPGVARMHTLRCGFLMRGERPVAGIYEWILKLIELRRRKYDLIVDFTGLFHSAAAAWFARAPLRVGPLREIPLGFFSLAGFGHFYTHEVPSEDEEHLADRMSRITAALGAPADSGGWEARLSDRAEKAAAELLRREGLGADDGPLVVIHPGAKWPPRQWAPENFSKVIDILSARGLRIAVAAGPGEEAAIESIKKHCGSSPIFLWPPEPLETFWGLLNLADAFLGNDSGPMHMAAAAGVPIVSIFGPNSPRRVAPRGSPLVPFYSNLECSPCPQYFTREKCHRGHNYCMDDYSPAEVAESVLRLIENPERPRRLEGHPAAGRFTQR